MRDERGYITYYDSLGLIAKGYIQKAVCRVLNAGKGSLSDYVCEMDATVELKYEKFLIEIFKTTDTGLIVNGVEYSSSFRHEIDDLNKLHIFDATGKRILVPVPYNMVRVNNSGQASSTTELAQWLTAIE